MKNDDLDRLLALLIDIEGLPRVLQSVARYCQNDGESVLAVALWAMGDNLKTKTQAFVE